MTINCKFSLPHLIGQNAPAQWVSLHNIYFILLLLLFIYYYFLVGGGVDVVCYLFMQAKTLNDFSNVRISGLLAVCLLMYVYAV